MPADLTKTKKELVAELEAARREIAKLKKADAKHKSTEVQSTTILDTAFDGFWVVDTKGRLLRVNHAAATMLGYTIEELQNLSVWEIDASETPNDSRRRINHLMAEGGGRFETRQRRKDGTIIDVEVSTTYLDHDGGQFVTFLRDITERKRAEEELGQSEESIKKKLQAVLEPEGDLGTLTLSDVIDSPALQSMMEDFYRVTNYPSAVIDLSGNILVAVGWQDACTKFHRTHPDTLQNCLESDLVLTRGVAAGTYKAYRCKNNLWDMVTPIMVGDRHMGNIFCGQFFYEDDPLDYDLFRKQARQSGFDEGEYLATIDKVPRFRRESVNMVMKFYAKLAGMISTLSYSTLKLSRAREAAEASSRAKSEFLATMSHEIRTPLNGVFGMIQILQETSLDANQQECLNVAFNSGKSLLRIIGDILDLSRIESGKMDVEVEEFQPCKVVSSIYSAFTIEIARKRLAINYLVDPALPAILLGDGGRIRQILFNLVGNAVKFTEKGEVDVRVYHDGLGDDSDCFSLCFEVADTGIGIPKDKLELIFEPFRQVDGSYTRKYGGSGLGLSIVKRLAEIMGGSVLIESEKGVGTTVRVRVPTKAVEGGKPAVEEHSTTAAISLPALKILLAEDDLSNQLVARRLLEKQGHTVTCVETGKEALAILEKDFFDLILMDVQMPEMDGTETTMEIRKDDRFKGLPIIALTAHAMSGDKERFLEAGMDDYLSKPIEVETLAEVIGRVMQSRGW